MPEPRSVYKISPSPDSTLAFEIRESGLIKHKYLFVFEQYAGTLIYDPESPLDSTLEIRIEADSLACRGVQAVKHKRRSEARLSRFAKQDGLSAQQHPELHIASKCFTAKQLRGFVVEGVLTFRGIDYPLRANLGFGPPRRDRLQIDADAALSLRSVGITPPRSHLGLVRIEDEAVLHALLWGVNSL